MSHEITIQVESSMIDENGHVNNVAYVDWMQRAALDHALIWQVEDFMKKNQATWFARRHEIIYLKPVFDKELVMVRTWIATGERVTSLRKYEFYRNEELVARGETEWVHVDSVTGRPKRIPVELRRFVEVEEG